MSASPTAIDEQQLHVTDVAELTKFVHHTLCARENLLENQFRTQTSELLSRGQPCGLQFSLHGPRSVRLGAIWAQAQNVVFFYDARGERYLKVKLQNRLNLDEPGSAN